MGDTSQNDIFARKPLLAFSLYTALQLDSLQLVRENLRDLKPSKSSPTVWECTKLQSYYSYFWLWVLGAYECLRTMNQHRECFSSTAQVRIQEMKKRVALLRIPFAKQELRGEKTTGQNPKLTDFYAENSAVDLDNGLIFKVDGQEVNSEELMEEVLAFFNDISSDDIVRGMPLSYAASSLNGKAD